MHYDDENYHNRLRVVFYKHGILDLDADADALDADADAKVDDTAYEMDLSSIHQCEFVQPQDLSQFLSCYAYLPELKSEFDRLPVEGWYMFTLRFVPAETFSRIKVKVVAVMNVSESKNEFHQLH